MGQIVPDAVEHYLSALNHQRDGILDGIARVGAAEGLPLVDAEVGALLRVLATSIRARRILEVGTAIGYSTIWLAGALPIGGMLFTIEKDAGRASRARENIARAHLSDRVTVMVGDAQLMLAKLSGPLAMISREVVLPGISRVPYCGLNLPHSRPTPIVREA